MDNPAKLDIVRVLELKKADASDDPRCRALDDRPLPISPGVPVTKHAIDVARPQLYSTGRRRQRHLFERDHFRILVDFDEWIGIIGDRQPQQQALGLDRQ